MYAKTSPFVVSLKFRPLAAAIEDRAPSPMKFLREVYVGKRQELTLPRRNVSES